MAGHTPGPWGWYGTNHGFYLATEHGGRIFVMDFVRMGIQGAQPRFQQEHRMVNAADLVAFEVGDGKARGFKAGKADPTVYRYDITSIDHPDARLIAAAPELLEAAQTVLADLNARIDAAPDTAKPVFRGIAEMHAAIARATPSPTRGSSHG